MKILNLGSSNIDYVYSLDRIVTPGETLTAQRMEIFPGGKGLNQSIAVARAGAPVYHAGCVGEDGDLLLGVLAESGVDTSYVSRVAEKNGHAIIQVNAQGENCIFVYSGSNGCVTTDYVDGVLHDFSCGDILLLQNEVANIDYAIRAAHEKGMQIVLNPSPFRRELQKIDLSLITYLILNEVEAAEYAGGGDARRSLAYFKEHYPHLCVMLTLGKNGCVYMDGSGEHFHPIFDVQAVDTTAAGDTFTGYFVAGLYRGDSIGSILKTASCASAIAVSRMGAAPSIPVRSEVEEALVSFSVKRKGKRDDAIRRKIEEYVAKNLKDASLTELSERLGYSVVYTGTLAVRLLGKSFTAYLQEKRLFKAHELLENDGLSIGEIIAAVGYENESYFRKLFKERYGKNPKAYRMEREKR